MKKDSLLKAVLATLFLAFPTLRALAFEVDGICYNVTSEDEMTVEVTTNSNGYSGDITIPATVEDENGDTCYVTGIGEYAFGGCKELTSVTLPSSITYIADRAFVWCSSLTSFVVPDGVTTIEATTFEWCTSLASVTLPDGITSIGEDAFMHCTSLVSINLPNSLITIGLGAFYDCESLVSITLPENLETIGDEAFAYCESLTSITIPSSVTSIGDSAFGYCISLTSINVEDNEYYNSVDGVLYNSDQTELLLAPAGFSATTYTVPSTVKTIDGYAFYGCSSLTSIEIPESVTSIGNYAFGECTGLTSIELSDSVTDMGYWMFEGCTSLVSAKLPSGLTSLDGTFAWCEKLASIDIPSGVTSIGLYAFNSCTSLTSIEIPAGVTTIGVYAFYDCTGLDSITSLNPEPPVCEYYVDEGDYPFDGVDKTTCVLTVPYEAGDDYAAADVWKDFENIVEIEPAGISAVAVEGQANVSGYYTIDGKQVSAPAKGVNIVKFADGTTKKVLAK